ncbi:hypothetical protein O181_049192 [Austropuccinia psidii MF-1]|uniref:CCHC-type domain-containing protein n=1 Tax=Austropuccinia psidii MF-1 TaxID=1389203 RepID=A0A9Q3E1C0_9BASI|nr:hypothetical protein [Austropuccinia psidii MF-1]
MENSFEEAIFNIERDRPMSWFLEQKDRLTALHPDMSETMVHKRILRKCGCDLEHAIRRRCIEPCSTEYYINAMEDITTRTKIGRNWYKPPMDNTTSGKPVPSPNKPHEKAPLKCHKCGITSHFSDKCPKKTRINEIEIGKMTPKKQMMSLYMKVILSLLKRRNYQMNLVYKVLMFPLKSQKCILTYHSTVMNVWISYMCKMQNAENQTSQR